MCSPSRSPLPPPSPAAPSRFSQCTRSERLSHASNLMPNSFQPHGRQHARLPCPWLFPGVCSNSCPLGQWCHLTITSSVALFSFCFQSFPASESFPISQLFASGGQSIGASLFSTSPSNEYSGLISLRVDWLVWSPYNPRDSQESSPTPQLESINSQALRLFYSPTLTSMHDYLKNNSFDYMDFCQQSDVCFLICSLVVVV